MSAVVEREYRSGDGSVSAVKIRMGDGNGATVRAADGMVSWADPDVWAFPERYGLERYTCPGHNGAVCFYGACDGIRMSVGLLTELTDHYSGVACGLAFSEDQAERDSAKRVADAGGTRRPSSSGGSPWKLS